MKVTELINSFKNRDFDEKLMSFYSDPSQLDYQRQRYVDLLNEYLQDFEDEEVMILSVPGRSEITGNHTDHQHGCVLACSINLDIICVAARSEKVEIYSNGRKISGVSLGRLNPDPRQQHSSAALVKGVIKCLKDHKYNVGGFRAVMRSNVLVGSGLSSSAAFEVMIGNIISQLYNEGSIDKVEIAKDSQYAENVYFGKPCGLMDQCACALGGIAYIDFRNPADPIIKQVNINFGDYGYSLCIINTGGSHSKLTDDYAAITREMKDVAGYFGAKVLRDVSIDQIINNAPALRDRFGDRAVMRSLHMLYENERVNTQLSNLERKDIPAFLKVIRESGNSSYKYLQNVHTNDEPTYQPISLALMLSEIFLTDQEASRVHGGGFAGTIQAFVRNENVATYKEYMEKVFGKDSCIVLQVNNHGAARVA